VKYTVRVKHSSDTVEPKFEEFEKNTRDADELAALHDEAAAAYVSAVQSYDHGHTVSLFRTNGPDDRGTGILTVHEALGTGSGQLAGDQDTDDNDPADVEAQEQEHVSDGEPIHTLSADLDDDEK